MSSSEDLSTQIINNPDLSQKLLAELVPIIYQGLKAIAQTNWETAGGYLYRLRVWVAPLILMNTSSRCHLSPGRGRRRRSFLA